MTTTTTTTNNNNNEIYSTVPQIYDYLSIQGLNTKFGLNSTDFDIFIIKELMDNALDFIESNAKEFVNGKRPFINVIITTDETEEVTKIRFRNSNAGINNIFTEERINKIFTLPEYHGSKRYRHKINRGELGDAFKAILCMPYAIAVHNVDKNNKYKNWDYPLEINISNDKRSIKIKIDNIDKIRRKELPYIDKKYFQFQNQEDEELNGYNHFTEVVVYLPKIAVDYIEIKELLEKYAVLNTHIDFKFKLPFRKEPRFFYPATQKLKSDWRNKESIYSYTLSEIEEYFQGIDKSHDNLNVYDNFIYTNFREGTNLSKKYDEILEKLTIGDLRYDTSKIKHIVQKMKDGMKPIKNQSPSLPKLDLPFDIKLREQALKERLKQVYFIEDSFIYKRFDKYYENPEKHVQFPYKLEIVIANSPILDQKRLTLIESLNYSPSLHADSLFTANDFIFRLKKFTVKNLLTILEICGYSIYNEKEHKKPYNLIIVNLISPRINYNSHNKSNIDLEPFAETFANELYRFCKNPSSMSKKNNGRNNSSNEEISNIGQLRILIKKRIGGILNNPELKKIGEWTQSTTFYILRKILRDKGIDVKDRKYITSKIKDVCEEMGFKRHELGIIAAERAQLYFKGQFRGVNLDDIPDLAKMGTDLIIIEKEGAVIALGPFADKYGIALLNTRGFLTEYAIDVAKKAGSNISILSDFDVSGLLLATKASDDSIIHRLGIDFQTLEDLDIDIEVVQEEYTPEDNSHYKHLKEKAKRDPKLKSQLDYLKHHRVEIDSVLAEVGNEKFWNYIIEKLEQIFPNRNYNKSIDVKDYVLPKEVDNLITNIHNKVSGLQLEEREKIKQELKNTEGFLDVKSKVVEIEERLRSVCKNDDVKKIISEQIEKFSSSLE